MKGGGRAPPPTPAWANFTLMMESTPESSRCYSVYSAVEQKDNEKKLKQFRPSNFGTVVGFIKMLLMRHSRGESIWDGEV
jgi:hypothetical protein